MEEHRTTAQKWIDKISRARKREREWRIDAEKATEIYEGVKQNEIPFDILYSNTETLIPALYNSTPRPQVKRRFKDADPIGKAAAQVAQRIASYCLDTNSEEYQMFDDVMIEAVLDAAVPGRGATRVRYDADVYEQTERAPALLNKEVVCYESVPWNKLIVGFSKKWTRVPWIAFEHDVSKPEAVKLFGKAAAEKLQYAPRSTTGEDTHKSDSQEKNTDTDTARIYEVWDSVGKEILFVADESKEDILKTDPDPGHFSGFYPIPEPLRFLRKSNNQLPTTLYSKYENQAEELNRLTKRINKIVEAVKVRGAYDSTIEELGQVFDQDDNKLVPATNVAALQDSGGLEKALWLVPIEKYVAALQQLYPAREACKQVIYEITGLADIMRGVTKASETLGAQQLKDQWGTLRLKRMQRDVQRYACEIIRMTIEVGAKSLSLITIQKMTGLSFPTMQEKMQAQQAIAMSQVAAQMGQQAPPPDPAAVAAASSPAWEEIMMTLKTDLLRQYKIDIETNSTIDLEATEDKKDLAELMNAMSQFLTGVAPLVETGAMPFQAAQSMLLMITRRFRFGDDVEDSIMQMQPPRPQGEDQGKAAASAAQIAQLQIQLKQNEAEKNDLERKVSMDLKALDLQALEKDLQHREEIFQMQQQLAQKQLELAQQSHEMNVQRTVETSQKAHEQKIGKMVEGASKEKQKSDVALQGAKAQDKVLQSFVKLQQQMIQSLDKTTQDNKNHSEKQTEILMKALMAPKVLVRDPKTGKATGSRPE